ncbi:MAG: Plug domain-containing protein [Chthoniobacteraceae bacterium]
MKALLAILLLAGCANAGERAPNAGKGKSAAVTGTNIARPVKRVGHTYDTPLAIHVIDRAQIEQSGASSVGQLLRRQPGVRVR